MYKLKFNLIKVSAHSEYDRESDDIIYPMFKWLYEIAKKQVINKKYSTLTPYFQSDEKISFNIILKSLYLFIDEANSLFLHRIINDYSKLSKIPSISKKILF